LALVECAWTHIRGFDDPTHQVRDWERALQDEDKGEGKVHVTVNMGLAELFAFGVKVGDRMG
jgi:hypothetical protein